MKNPYDKKLAQMQLLARSGGATTFLYQFVRRLYDGNEVHLGLAAIAPRLTLCALIMRGAPSLIHNGVKIVEKGAPNLLN